MLTFSLFMSTFKIIMLISDQSLSILLLQVLDMSLVSRSLSNQLIVLLRYRYYRTSTFSFFFSETITMNIESIYESDK